MKRIGVLGGISAAASAAFYTRLVSALNSRGALRTNTDYPQIILNSIPGPEFDDCEDVSDEFLAPYIDGLQLLERAGAEAIVMVCNTIHHFLPVFERHVRIPIADMRVAIRREVATRRSRKVVVLGTSFTMHNNLYGLDPALLHPLTAEQERFLCKLIHHVAVDGISDADRLVFSQFVSDLKRECDTILLGCTELALLHPGDGVVVNSLEVFVDEAYRLVIQEGAYCREE